MEIQFFSIFFVLFCCNDSTYHSLNWKDVSVTNVDIFEKKQFSLQFFYSLLQVYIVHRVSFIFHLDVLLVAVCTRGFAYLLCWPRGRGIGLVCTRRFSFHEFYKICYSIFNFYFVWKTFFTHDIYPHPHPRHFALKITFWRARPNEKRAWYKPSMKRLPPIFSIDWHLPNQPTKITSVACFLVCKFFIRGKIMQTRWLVTHISSVNKANSERIWTATWIFWISMPHIKAYFPTIRP